MRYDYTIRPRQAGSSEMPPVNVSFYDVTTRRYRTVSTAPIPLKVRQASEVTAAQVIGGSTNQTLVLRRRDESAMIPAGIRMDAKACEPASLTGAGRRLMGILITGPLIFLATLLTILTGRHLPAFKTARRRRNALAQARERLSQHPHPPGTACSVMRQYLAERLDQRTDSMTPSEARALLLTNGIPDDLADRFAALMQRHFDATFSTTATAPDSESLAATLGEIEQRLRSAPKPASAATLLAAFLILTGTATLKAATLEERGFVWDEAVAELGTAHTPAEFLAAAATCQKLADLGVRNATLFYNQGTALLLAGKPEDAVAVLLRAERYGGSTPDVRRNLAIAQAKKDGLTVPEVSWLRLVLAWHYRLDCATRTTLASLAFSGLWIAGALWLAGARRTGKTVMILTAIVFALTASSVLATLHQESHIERPKSLTNDIAGHSV